MKKLLLTCAIIGGLTGCVGSVALPDITTDKTTESKPDSPLKTTIENIKTEDVVKQQIVAKPKQTEVTFNDIPRPTLLINSSSRHVKSTGSNYEITCSYIYSNCYVTIPNDLTLKPVTDVSGVAIYAGNMKHKNSANVYRYLTSGSSRIALEVDFDKRTIEQRNVNYPLKQNTNFDIMATFNDTGGITGQIIIHPDNDDSQTCSGLRFHCYPITGIIGQEKMVAIYKSPKYQYSLATIYAGGFTAERISQ